MEGDNFIAVLIYISQLVSEGQFSEVASVPSLRFPEVIYGSLTPRVLSMTLCVVGPGRTL